MRYFQMSSHQLQVAVVGASGVVGQEMISLLESRKFPLTSLRLFASKKSAGKTARFKNKKIKIELLEPEAIQDIDLALFSAGATVSKEFAPIFAQRGAFVVDNSSAWRMDKHIPLVVPEVNPDDISAQKKIIANPNCSTIQMVVALKPLHDKAKIETIHVSTYQAVSGAGSAGINDLVEQSKAWAKNRPLPAPKKIAHQIAFNLVPQIDVFTENGYTKEEMKMVNETQKIMGSNSISVSATCVRVPVFRSHSEAVWIRTKEELSVSQATALLAKAPGVTLIDNPAKLEYPMPFFAAHQSKTFVGRIRKDLTDPKGLLLWIVSDNLLKGAALNAVEISELLLKKKLI